MSKREMHDPPFIKPTHSLYDETNNRITSKQCFKLNRSLVVSSPVEAVQMLLVS